MCAATAFGARGPDAGAAATTPVRTGRAAGCSTCFTQPDAAWPTATRPAFGDVVGGLTIAGAVSAALYHRATTGLRRSIDASLLASGMWQIQPDIVNAKLGDEDIHPLAAEP